MYTNYKQCALSIYDTPLTPLNPSLKWVQTFTLLFPECNDFSSIPDQYIKGNMSRIQASLLNTNFFSSSTTNHLSSSEITKNIKSIDTDIKLNDAQKSKQLKMSGLYLAAIFAVMVGQTYFMCQKYLNAIREESDPLVGCIDRINSEQKYKIAQSIKYLKHETDKIQIINKFLEEGEGRARQECQVSIIEQRIAEISDRYNQLYSLGKNDTSLEDTWFPGLQNGYALLTHNNYGYLSLFLWSAGFLFILYQLYSSRHSKHSLMQRRDTLISLNRIVNHSRTQTSTASKNNRTNKQKSPTTKQHVYPFGQWDPDKQFLTNLAKLTSPHNETTNIALSLDDIKSNSSDTPTKSTVALPVNKVTKKKKLKKKKRKKSLKTQISKKTQPKITALSIAKSELKWIEESKTTEISFVSIHQISNRITVFRASITSDYKDVLEKKDFDISQINSAFRKGFVRDRGQNGFKKLQGNYKGFVEIKMSNNKRLFMCPTGVTETEAQEDFQIHRTYLTLFDNNQLARYLHKGF